jgi:putative FmdB family regulatory protein
MPFYDYKCGECGHTFEEMLRIADMEKPTKKKCPSCGKKKVEIVVGAPSIVDSVRVGITKPDKGWQEVMAKIKEAHPRNDMSRKSKQDWMH